MTAVETSLFMPPQPSEEPFSTRLPGGGRLTSPNARTASPPSKLRASLQESIHSSRVLRDLSPTRVFASTPTSTTRTSLPDLFKQKGSLQLLRPNYSNEVDLQDEGSRQPKLLARLQALLDEKLEFVDRLGGARKGFAAAQLRTDAYRQVYDAFLHSFTTYRSLLMRIKHEYDIALDDALASVYDNVHMRAELAVAEERLETAVLDARDAARMDVSSVRQEIQDQLESEEATLGECEKRSMTAEVAITQCHMNNSRLRQELDHLKEQNHLLKRELVAGSSWKRADLMAAYQAAPGRTMT